MKLQRLLNSLPPPFQKKLILIGIRTLCLYLALGEKNKVKKTNFLTLPPPYLRFKAHGMPFLDRFLRRGKKATLDLDECLARIGRELDSFDNILDFGCGCGRMLIWLDKKKLHSKLYGTDIDKEVITWCCENFKFASFYVNDYLPPLHYPTNTFDLIYASAVFIHLKEEDQLKWLEEFKRILNDKGILVITILGRNAWNYNYHENKNNDLEKNGIIYLPLVTRNFSVTYQTKEYVFDRFSKFFKILEYIPKGMNEIQDVIVLQK